VIKEARVALGGVATRPWRARESEQRLQGVALDDLDALRQAAASAFLDARPLRDNGFKAELGTRAIVAASTPGWRRRVTALVGAPRDRVDGPAKVTGDARYSADIALEGMAHAVFATSTVAAWAHQPDRRH
jgi:CO/xanthine dehydrogenase FAD-binding subunit